MTEIREQILATVDDLVTDFMHYDRKEDELLPRFAIEQAIQDGEVTVDEIVNRFRKGIQE